MGFEGKVALVTGSGRGIGEVTAKLFAHKGAAVVILDLSLENALKVQDDITKAGGRALAVQCDITNEEDVILAVAAAVKEFGKVDILVNNAAVFRGGYLDEMELSAWQVPIRVTLDGTFLCCKHVLKGMKERKYGKIVNISSAAILHPFPTYGAYAAAKSGLLGYSQTLQEEVRAYQINVNTVILGLTNTEDVSERATIPPDDMLQPIDVANTIVFLCSDEARGFKGAALEHFGDYK